MSGPNCHFSNLFLGPQDIKHIGSDEERRCVRHCESGVQCNLPELDAFGAGFSCTSLSSLNGEAGQNTTAIGDNKAFWLQCAICVDEKKLSAILCHLGCGVC